MKFLFDQNISHRILKILPENFNSSSSVKKENLLNATDRLIWAYAKKNDYIIVTQDSDFNDLNLLFGFPPKIVWIRAGNISTETIANILKEQIHEIEQFMNDFEHGCFEILALQR